ncbi:MAG: sigma-70 family RNA polymerase sigma factor [Planctomycetes bacterium]|nr:sigma-70 family RNA polymerase sigma factor [Planctomycetota bacterium]
MDEPATDDASDRIRRLLPHLDAFVAFTRKRVGDAAVAEDVVQDAMLKAIRNAPQLRDEDELVAWAYRILRNTITDMFRRRSTDRTHEHALSDAADQAVDTADAAEVCRCMNLVIDALKPGYAEVLRDDLAGVGLDATATRLGLTPENLKVRRHRARIALRERLEATCRICAKHGCLDCQCAEAQGHDRSV